MTDAINVQVWIDDDYARGMQHAVRLLKQVAPEVEPFDSLVGVISQLSNAFSKYTNGDKWTNDRWREEYRDLMRQNDANCVQWNRCIAALQRIAHLGDIMTDVHHEAFNTGPGLPIVNGWRVAEKMRDVANEALGNEPACETCGGEGQIQLTDEGGNRMWWACPVCRDRT